MLPRAFRDEARLYRYIDQNGVVYYSFSPPPKARQNAMTLSSYGWKNKGRDWFGKTVAEFIPIMRRKAFAIRRMLRDLND
jgi:hypothetical protein